MNKLPLVSIIIPVYGVEKYIEECARALFSQTYANCEFIFVDDASEDRSIEILNATISDYRGIASKIKFLRHSANEGLVAARKTGQDAALGEWVLHFDSDDVCELDYIKKLVTCAIEGNYDIVSPGLKILRGNSSKRLETPWVAGANASLLCILSQSFTIHNRVCSLLIRRSIAEKIIFNKRLKIGEDMAMSSQILSHAKRIAHVRDAIYFYRCDNPSAMTYKFSRKEQISYLRAVNFANKIILQQLKPKEIKCVKLLQSLNLKRWLMLRAGMGLRIDGIFIRVLAHSLNRLFEFCLRLGLFASKS